MKHYSKLSAKYETFFESLGIILLFAIGILVRSDTSLVTIDMSRHFFSWYRQLRDQGIIEALKESLSNYPPLYLYLLGLTTLTDSLIPKVTAIKSIPIIADFLSAYFIYKIVRIKFQFGVKPIVAAGFFLILPTVFLNSAYWGQIESLYTLFLIASLLFILKERPVLGIIVFSLAFSIKIQSVFYGPFLVFLL